MRSGSSEGSPRSRISPRLGLFLGSMTGIAALWWGGIFIVDLTCAMLEESLFSMQ